MRKRTLSKFQIMLENWQKNITKILFSLSASAAFAVLAEYTAEIFGRNYLCFGRSLVDPIPKSISTTLQPLNTTDAIFVLRDSFRVFFTTKVCQSVSETGLKGAIVSAVPARSGWTL
jgi:hypothetical protein